MRNAGFLSLAFPLPQRMALFGLVEYDHPYVSWIHILAARRLKEGRGAGVPLIFSTHHQSVGHLAAREAG